MRLVDYGSPAWKKSQRRAMVYLASEIAKFPKHNRVPGSFHPRSHRAASDERNHRQNLPAFMAGVASD
jgi:hypothetical protein